MVGVLRVVERAKIPSGKAPRALWKIAWAQKRRENDDP
jgi:hypothetical protein